MTILVPLWFLIISLMFFYLSKLFFSGFHPFKGDFVCYGWALLTTSILSSQPKGALLWGDEDQDQ